MLEWCRVLDISDERGQLAGAMLAGLGADVVLVEPPGGSRSRRIGPFLEGVASDHERSLGHWAYNRGKTSVTLDLATSDADRQAFLRLAETADVLVESAAVGHMSSLGLGYAELAAANPGLVYVSITAFGQEGPKSQWAATDLTVWAAGMALALAGDDDRPPVRVGLPQAFLHASADAACGALIALHERELSAIGQHVDISAQQASLLATQSMVLAAPLRSPVVKRSATGARFGPFHIQIIWPCKDGHVSIALLFGAAIGPATGRLMQWICEEGLCDEATRDKNWIDYFMLLLSGQEPPEEYERVKQVVGSFTATKTKQELLAGALERRLLIAPIATIGDVVDNRHFEARGYWDRVDDPGVASQAIIAPGPFAKPSATPLPRLGRAPRLGEHTEAVLAEIPQRRRATSSGTAVPSRQAPALDGLKVLDFMWAMAGPAISRVLADHGATVVRVESATRLDVGRTGQPFLDDIIDPERSGFYANMNAGKLGCAVNMAKPEAHDVICDLVRWADVVAESFSPRAMRGWGLDYERLREVNPRIIMLSTCLMGQTGPMANFAGYGNLGAAVSGFYNLAGWPDRPPAGPFGAYTDYVSPRYGLAVLLAALDHRRRSGEGQHIDLSQAEASLHFLAPAIVDYTVSGHLFERDGNRDPGMAPHGVYPCAGDDQWVAIACTTDENWRALSEVMGRDDLGRAPHLSDLEGRKRNETELDEAVAEWTRALTPDEATARCQAAGVPAHAVQSSEECWRDPQLAHRQHFVEVAHPVAGPITVEGSRIKLSRTPGRVDRSGPPMGQDTSAILRDTLGYSDDRIADLYAAEVLE